MTEEELEGIKNQIKIEEPDQLQVEEYEEPY